MNLALCLAPILYRNVRGALPTWSFQVGFQNDYDTTKLFENTVTLMKQLN